MNGRNRRPGLDVSALAETIGAGTSGLLTPFPIPALILKIFTRRHDGPNVVAGLLRTLVLGLFSREASCALSAAGAANIPVWLVGLALP